MPTSKLFLKKLKLFNKKMKGGGGPIPITDPNQKNTYESELNATKNIAELASYSTFALSIASNVIGVASPLLTISGVGIPLAAVLVVCSKLIEKYKDNLLLTNLLEYVIEIILNCYFLEMLITLTIQTFNKKIDGLNKDSVSNPPNQSNKPIASIKIKDEIKQMLKSKINHLNKYVVEITPVDKVKHLNDELTKTTPPTSTPPASGTAPNENTNNGNDKKQNSGFFTDKINYAAKSIANNVVTRNVYKATKSAMNSETAKYFTRAFDAKTTIDNILRELSVVNSFFIFYNNQFDWIIRQSELTIKNRFKTNSDEILNEIWGAVYTSNEYSQYINGLGPNTDNNIKLVLEDLGIENVKKIETDATAANDEVKNFMENADQNQTNGGIPTSGGKRTKRRKIRKPKRKYTHRFTVRQNR